MYMKPLTSVSTVIYFTISLAKILFSFSFVNHTILVVVMAFWCSNPIKFIIVELLDILCWLMWCILLRQVWFVMLIKLSFAAILNIFLYVDYVKNIMKYYSIVMHNNYECLFEPIKAFCLICFVINFIHIQVQKTLLIN